MAVRQMSETQIHRWVRDMENQGVRVIRTKKGLMLRLPNGRSAMKHFTESDVRGPKNLAAELRRAGVISPDDKKPAALPKYITEGTITQTSRKRLVSFMESHDFPPVVYSKDVVKELGMDPGSVNRVLYHCGFTVGDAMDRKGRPWYTPDELLAMKKKDDDGEAIPAQAKSIIDGARAAQAEIDALTLPERDATPEEEAAILESIENPDFVEVDPPAEVEAMPIYEHPDVVVEKSSFHEGREFIDTHDSWVVDLGQLPTDMTVGQYMQSLTANGLAFEFRVWRAR